MNIERLFSVTFVFNNFTQISKRFRFTHFFSFFLSNETSIVDKWRWNNKIIANSPWVQRRRRLVHGEKTTHANQVKAGNKRNKKNRCVENSNDSFGTTQIHNESHFPRRKAIKSDLFTIKIRPFSMRLKNIISTM